MSDPDDFDVPVQAIARKKLAGAEAKGNKRGQVRRVSIPKHGRLLTQERALAKKLAVLNDALPPTRGDCKGHEGPCPMVSCRYHLYLEVLEDGAIQINFPHLEVWEMEETCALDVADKGRHTLAQTGRFMGVTRERTRQIEERALLAAREELPK